MKHHHKILRNSSDVLHYGLLTENRQNRYEWYNLSLTYPGCWPLYSANGWTMQMCGQILLHGNACPHPQPSPSPLLTELSPHHTPTPLLHPIRKLPINRYHLYTLSSSLFNMCFLQARCGLLLEKINHNQTGLFFCRPVSCSSTSTGIKCKRASSTFRVVHNLSCFTSLRREHGNLLMPEKQCLSLVSSAQSLAHATT